MRLNHPGVYRIIGKDFELLANIEGEAPLFKITSAILINDLVNYGRINELQPDSLQIRQILEDPDSFVFLEYEYSEVATLPNHRKSIRGNKMPKITDFEMKDFIQRYIYDFKNNRPLSYTKAYIMERTNFTLPQINLLIMGISKEARKIISTQLMRNV